MNRLSDLFVESAPHAPSVQRCAQCGTTLSELDPSPVCPDCNGLLDVVHARPVGHTHHGHGTLADALRAEFAAASGAPGTDSGVWRYRSLVMPHAGAAITSHPEGNTPLLIRHAISQHAGVEQLQIKHEGHNPTGSFKDRGMTVGVTQAVRIGATAVACASTGNTSASLASYAAQAGIPGLVFVPTGQIAMGKLAQTLSYGARTIMVRGDFDACLRLAQDAAHELGIYLLNSINPWRIEGQKTIVFELLQQRHWEPPDFLVLPAGNLGNTAAFGKALREAHALGLIARVPRIVSVQAAGAAPFATGYTDDFRTHQPVKATTIATAIKIGDPASWDRGVRAIRDTNGIVVACSDDEILEAKLVIDAAGVGCEPASAASVAGVRQLVRRGIIQPTDSVVAVLTGHVLKDPGILAELHQGQARPGANPPVEIDADVRAVAAILNEGPRTGRQS